MLWKKEILVFTEKFPAEGNYDYLRFFIDDTEVDQWSGDAPWGQEVIWFHQVFIHSNGNMIKMYSISTGEDCAWIDYIVFPLS